MDATEVAGYLRARGFIEGEMSVDPLLYIIWDPEDVARYNEEYELSEYAPGFAAFGHNGANELLTVDQAGVVYSLPAIGMSTSSARRIANDVVELEKYLHGAAK